MLKPTGLHVSSYTNACGNFARTSFAMSRAGIEKPETKTCIVTDRSTSERFHKRRLYWALQTQRVAEKKPTLGQTPNSGSRRLLLAEIPLRVQVPNNHTLIQNLYYEYYYPNPKYLIIGYMDPLGCVDHRRNNTASRSPGPGTLS